MALFIPDPPTSIPNLSINDDTKEAGIFEVRI